MEPTVLDHWITHNFPVFKQTNMQNDETLGKEKYYLTPIY